MSIYRKFLVCALLSYCTFSHSNSATSKRIPQLSNERVQAWKTIIYPTAKKKLAMHRHDHDRVIVALTDGLLKIKNNSGKVHYLSLKKNQSYYLEKDPIQEFHTDENMSHHPIQVIVIELS